MDRRSSSSSSEDEKTGLPPPYTQGGAFPQQHGSIPPPAPGTFVQTGAPPGVYPNQPVPGAYGVPVGGYQTGQPPVAGYPPPPQPQTYYFSNYTPNSVGSMQTLIPIMPMGVAITLCVVNCFLPGFGTMIAGMTVCCCADMQQQPNSTSSFGLFCINFWLGWLQLFMVFFVVGWVWSIMWGVLFIMISDQFYGKPPPTTTTVIQTTTVPMQPQ